MNYSKKLFVALFLFPSFSSLFAQKQSTSCGVNDAILPDSIVQAMQMTPIWLKQKQTRKAANDLYVCRLAIDIDSDTYIQFDSDTILIKYEVLKMIERVSKVFEAEVNTKLVVTHINIWKDVKTDPYKGITDIFQLLNTLSNTWTKSPFKSLPFDKVMYLPTKSFSGAGGVANNIGGQFNVSPYGGENVIAHELGHCLGSPHTQSCSWPGGVIDHCYPSEGSCYEESLDYIKGTIMSYCSATFSFHPLCQAIMQNYAEKNFKKIQKPETPTFNSPVTNLNVKPYLLINPVIFAENYEYQVAQSEDFTKNQSIDSVQVNALKYTNFKNNNTYFLKVRAKNRLGNSDWSNVVSLTIPETVLTAPVLKTPLHNVTNVDPSKDITLTFDKVEGATNYELGLARYDDFNFKYSQNSNTVQISTTNSFNFNINKSGYGYKMLFWRVRAIKSNVKGAWSEARRIIFTVQDGLLSLPFIDNNSVPTSFPLTFNIIDENYDFKCTISKNDNFTNPVVEKYVKQGVFYNNNLSAINVDNLTPNTQYFLKIEVINPKPDLSFGVPAGILRTSIQTFRTGNDRGYLSNYKVFNKDNTANFANTVYDVNANNKNIFISSSEGLVKLQLDSSKAKIFTHENTNGQLGNNSISTVDLDSLGNILKIITLSKRKAYNGAFPKPVYALRKFDGITMKLISSQEFQGDSVMNYINYFDSNSKIVGDGQNVGIIGGDMAKTFLSLDTYYYQMIASKNYLWFRIYNNTQREYEVRRYNFKTKEITIIPKAPTLNSGNYNFDNIKIDRNENLWLCPSAQGIAKYDGKIWTVFNSSNSMLNRVTFFEFDKFDNIYISTNRNYPDNAIVKYNGTDFKEIVRPKVIFNSPFLVDFSGKIWLKMGNTSLLKYDPCSQITKPSFASNNIGLDYGKSTTLEAKGCNNVVWNWKNKEENTYEKLISGTNKVNVSPKSNTVFSARCYDDGCSGEETTVNVKVNPVLLINRVDKIQYCSNDTLRIYPKIEGFFEDNNVISGTLTSSQETFTISLINNKTYYSFLPNPKILSGKYWLKIQGTSPKIVSKDSVEITILFKPTASISGDNSFCDGGSARLLAGSNASKSAIYQWVVNNSSIIGNNSSILTTNADGKYYFLVNDNNGCISRSPDFNVVKTSNPTVNITGTNSFCKGLNTTLTSNVKEGTPPYSYIWNEGDTTKTGNNTNTLIVSKGGNYKVFVIDSKSCVVQSTVYSVTQNEYPVITLIKNNTTDITQNTTTTLSIPTVAGQSIQWNKDGVSIAGATNNSLIITQPGNYTVSVSTNGCTTISEIVVINLITSNEPNTLENIGLKVFPNPNDGSFTVEFNSTDLKPTELTISDVLGRSIFRKTIKIVGKYSQQINISEQPAGQYFISVQKEDGVKTVKMTKK